MGNDAEGSDPIVIQRVILLPFWSAVDAVSGGERINGY